MINKILIIDDNEVFCEELADILKNDGYSVTITFDGHKGNELIKTCQYDLLLLDLG